MIPNACPKIAHGGLLSELGIPAAANSSETQYVMIGDRMPALAATMATTARRAENAVIQGTRTSAVAMVMRAGTMNHRVDAGMTIGEKTAAEQ